MNEYNVRLKHDQGITTIRLAGASSPESAREMIKKIELCPDRAILSITVAKPRKWSKEL